MKTFKELLLEEERIERELSDIKKQIADFSDGEVNMVITQVRHWPGTTLYNNLHSAIVSASYYNGDNGFANVFTTHKTCDDYQLQAGYVYHIKNLDEFNKAVKERRQLDEYVEMIRCSYEHEVYSDESTAGDYEPDIDACISCGQVKELSNGYCSKECYDMDNFNDDASYQE